MSSLFQNDHRNQGTVTEGTQGNINLVTDQDKSIYKNKFFKNKQCVRECNFLYLNLEEVVHCHQDYISAQDLPNKYIKWCFEAKKKKSSLVSNENPVILTNQ